MTSPATHDRVFKTNHFCLLIAIGVFLVSARDGLAVPSPFEQVVTSDAPEMWWRMDATGTKVVNHGVHGTALEGQIVGETRLAVAGPSGEEFPDFSPSNTAIGFPPGPHYIRIIDPGPESILDFDQGDEITIEAWIQPDRKQRSQYSYIVGKGRTLKGGTGDRNQNYSLRLDARGTAAKLSFYFVDAETETSKADPNTAGHRWTSSLTVPLDGYWHHVAVTYKFGEPTSIAGYIDGKVTKGTWDLAGPTTKRPLVDDDELWIGSSMAGRATFHGAIDEVAIYRKVLAPDAIARHVRIQRRDEVLEAVKSVAKLAPEDHVQYDVFEGISDVREWTFRPTERVATYESNLFALTELPRKYDARGVIADRERPLMIHAYAKVTLPAGTHRLLLRSLNAARLYVDRELLAENPFLMSGSSGHGKVYPLQPPTDGELSLPAAHNEKKLTFVSDGKPHVFSVLALAGESKRPAELGEIVLACQTAGGLWRILGAEHHPIDSSAEATQRELTDEGWLQFLEQDAQRRQEWENESRRQASRDEDQFWKRRHDWARNLVAQSERTKIPKVDDDSQVNNPIDSFVQRKLEEEKIRPAPLIEDLSFLRRLSLDTVGTIPTPQQIEAFLADPVDVRRERAIDRFLADPGWADHWVSYWQDVLAENPGITKPMLNNSGPFRWYLYEAFLDNKPLDRFVTELVMMEGGKGSGGPADFAVASNNDVPMAHKAHVLASGFLGVEMKCARCHDAPSHESTQEHLFSLAAMLARKPVKVPSTSSVPGTPEQLEQMAVTVSLTPGSAVAPDWPLEHLSPRSLDVPKSLQRQADDSRGQLAWQITHPANRRFAEVFVNRLWARYLGRGFVEPLHDWEASDPTDPDLLAYLAEELVLSGYDIKHLARLIFSSQAYQRQGPTPDMPEQAAALFACQPARLLSAEQITDSIFQAVGKPFDSEELNINPDGRQSAGSFFNLGTPRRAWQFVSASNERERPSMALPKAQSVVDLLASYGWRQNRQEPVSEREQQLTPLSPLLLANGIATSRAVDFADHGDLVALALEDITPDELLERLMFRFLTRAPTAAERDRYVAYLSEGFAERCTGKPPKARRVDRSPLAWSNHLDAEANQIGEERIQRAQEGDEPTEQLSTVWRERAEDVVWVLINSPEFVVRP